MKASINRLQIPLFIVTCLSGIIVIVSIAFDHSLHVFRYAGYCMFILLGLLCLNMSYKDTGSNLQTNENIARYKQPLRSLGIIFILAAVLFFCIHDLPSLLF